MTMIWYLITVLFLDKCLYDSIDYRKLIPQLRV